MALVPSRHHMGFWGGTQVTRFVQQSPLPTGPSHCPSTTVTVAVANGCISMHSYISSTHADVTQRPLLAKELVLSDPAFVTTITVTWSCFLPQEPIPYLPPPTLAAICLFMSLNVIIRVHTACNPSAFYCLVHPCLIAPSNSKWYLVHMNSQSTVYWAASAQVCSSIRAPCSPAL